MKMKSLRQAILMAALFAGTAALVTSPVLAQTPPGPPVCGGVASLMNHQIFIDTDGSGPAGNNLVSIPSVSPINNNPTSVSNNGFVDLCRRFGLFVAAPAPTSSITQFNPSAGTTTTYLCSTSSGNPSPAPTFVPGQAVMIQPIVNADGRIPGVECARPYTTYTDTDGTGPKGNNLWPTPITFAGGGAPLTTTAGGARDICNQLVLPTGTTITQFKADAPAAIQVFTCGQAGPASNTLRIGEAVMIQPPNLATSTGTPLIF
jgi:hypothetical protein